MHLPTKDDEDSDRRAGRESRLEVLKKTNAFPCLTLPDPSEVAQSAKSHEQDHEHRNGSVHVKACGGETR